MLLLIPLLLAGTFAFSDANAAKSYKLYIDKGNCGQFLCFNDIALTVDGIVVGSTVNFRSEWGTEEPFVLRPGANEPGNPINGPVSPGMGYLPVIFDKVGTFHWYVEDHPEVSSFVKVIEAPPPPPPSIAAEKIPLDKRLKIKSGEWVATMTGTGKLTEADTVTYNVNGEFAFTVNQDGSITGRGDAYAMANAKSSHCWSINNVPNGITFNIKGKVDSQGKAAFTSFKDKVTYLHGNPRSTIELVYQCDTAGFHRAAVNAPIPLNLCINEKIVVPLKTGSSGSKKVCLTSSGTGYMNWTFKITQKGNLPKSLDVTQPIPQPTPEPTLEPTLEPTPPPPIRDMNKVCKDKYGSDYKYNYSAEKCYKPTIIIDVNKACSDKFGSNYKYNPLTKKCYTPDPTEQKSMFSTPTNEQKIVLHPNESTKISSKEKASFGSVVYNWSASGTASKWITPRDSTSGLVSRGDILDNKMRITIPAHVTPGHYKFSLTTAIEGISGSVERTTSNYDVEVLSKQIQKTSNQKVPSWIKDNARWWSEGSIADKDFLSGIEYMMEKKLIKITSVQANPFGSSSGIPDWVKTSAGWWADGQISEDDFVKGLEYLVEQGMIRTK